MLYKFRTLSSCKDLERVKDIIENGFYCNDFISFNDMNEGVYTHNKNSQTNLFSEKYKYKICSFSKESALNNELMWGHYADAGKGLVIEVEVDEKIEEFMKDITYTSELESFETFLDTILTTKTLAWSYESECRYINNRGEDNEVIIGKVTKIYFGTPYEILENYEDILEKNRSLQKYHLYKNELKDYLSSTSICYEDYSFEDLGSSNEG